MNLSELKTIDVQTLEWFDKVNGNTYFASTITLNLGMQNETTLYNEFQYGYDSSHAYKAFAKVKEFFGIDKDVNLSDYCYDNNIITRTSKKSALKREVKAIGK